MKNTSQVKNNLTSKELPVGYKKASMDNFYGDNPTIKRNQWFLIWSDIGKEYQAYRFTENVGPACMAIFFDQERVYIK